MIIGDPAQFAIECVIQEWVDDIWVFGHFRFWLGGHTVGDWEDSASLRGCVSWIRDFIDTDVQRFDPMLTGKSREEVFHMLYDSVMDPTLSDQSVSIEDSSDIYRRYHISHLGMSSFNRVGLLLIETPECQRVIWHETGDPTIYEVKLPVGEMQRIGEAFCQWFQKLDNN